jgi:type IV pilus assembly protein PilA
VNTNADFTQAEMYEAFIGPAKASYYVPIFERFDSGAGAMSWNWPAAFITQLWMLYRGMFLWGFLWYPILSFIASLLVMLPFMAVAGDSGEALSYLVLLPASIIVMGLFSNKIFHGHVRKMIDKSGRLGLSAQQRREWLIRKGASNFVFVFIMVVIVPIVGILAAIAIPAYQDYTIRAKVADGLIRAGAVKATYLDYVTKNQEWPASMDNLGLPETGAEYGPSVASVTIGAEHEIRIVFSEQAIAGKTIVLVPSVQNDSLVWSCNAETLPAKYAPAACRH